MALFATRHPDASEQEKLDVIAFRRSVIVSYTSSLDARVSWSTLISALKILGKLFTLFIYPNINPTI